MKPLARQRRMLPAVDNDDAWQELLAEKKLPDKDERLSTILSLAAHNTSQLARRAHRDGSAHVELLDTAQELLREMEVKRTLREDERHSTQTDQWQPSPQVRRRHATHAGNPHRTISERFQSINRISSELSGLEAKLRQSLGETASAAAMSLSCLSPRPATTATSATGTGSPVKATARNKTPQRPSTARDEGLRRQYQAWQNLTSSPTQDQEEDRIFRAWATGTESAAENEPERGRSMSTDHCEHSAAAEREALRRVGEQVSGL
jgi:hypothetical protein